MNFLQKENKVKERKGFLHPHREPHTVLSPYSTDTYFRNTFASTAHETEGLLHPDVRKLLFLDSWQIKLDSETVSWTTDH